MPLSGRWPGAARFSLYIAGGRNANTPDGVAAEVTLPGEDWEYQIRHRAYELWNAAGRPDGKHQQFWEAAERELKRAEAAEKAATHAADAQNGSRGEPT